MLHAEASADVGVRVSDNSRPASLPRILTGAPAWVLPLLVLLSVQTWMVFREPIFSPIDELEHVDYVRTVALEHRLPVWLHDRVAPELVALYFHHWPNTALTPSEQAGFPPNRYSYEAIQFPLFYLLAAPVYAAFAGGNPATAIYAVRLENVVFSAIWLLIIIRLLRTRMGVEPWLASGIACSLLLIPGVALRDSQVMNEVLSQLLGAVVILLALRRQDDRPGRNAALEAGLVTATTMAKLTSLALLAGVGVAWLTRPSGLRRRLLAGTAAFALLWLPWLAYSLPVYGSVLPWHNHPSSYFQVLTWSPPATLPAALTMARTYLRYFWLPWEWTAAGHPLRLAFIAGAMLVGNLTMLMAILLGVWDALRWRTDRGRAAAIVLASVVALCFGYVLISYARHWVWETDLRELYSLFGGIAVLYSNLAVRIPRPTAYILFWGMTGSWLVCSYFLLAIGVCDRCYP